jgi:chromosomal replication initiation ATPase DnaA
MTTIPEIARVITKQNVVSCGPTALVKIGAVEFLRVGINVTASLVAISEIASIQPLTGRPADAHRLLATVADVFGVDVRDIVSKSRLQEHVHPRFAFWLLAWENRFGTTSELSRMVGRDDHGSMIHGRDRARELCDVDKHFLERVEAIRAAMQPNDKPRHSPQ